jgi:hypothetical protein
MNDEGLLANDVSATKKKAKQLLDGVVSAMKTVRNGVGGKK